jgi:hypothetical protein
MSFPTLREFNFAEMTEEEQHLAALRAMENDTPLGFTVFRSIVTAFKEQVSDPVSFVQQQIPVELRDQVLRFERLPSGALKVDLNPNEPMARQVARMMTDAMRKVLCTSMEVEVGFANCCGIIIGTTPESVRVTIADQAGWQEDIDC